MISEGLEKDFTNWEFRVARECEIVHALLGEDNVENEPIFEKLDKLARFFSTDAPKFVEILKEINNAVFVEKITKRERIESEDLFKIVEILEEKHRIPTMYIKNIKSFMEIDSTNFENIKLPAKQEIFKFKAMPKGEERDEKKVELDNLHAKFEKLIICMISFSNIISWYYRTYEEKPDIAFLWDYDGDGGEKKRKESGELVLIQEFQGILDTQYNIMRAPIRFFNKTVLVEECRKFDKIIKEPYQFTHEITVEKAFSDSVPFVRPVEIIHEKYFDGTGKIDESETSNVSEIIDEQVKAVQEVEEAFIDEPEVEEPDFVIYDDDALEISEFEDEPMETVQITQSIEVEKIVERE
ncbi:MAG: hypothetical protein K8S87_02810, partial [Planctomycetes bacterium]|nr:hypothetical protein [Planctomycetota bacterium]